MTFQKYGRNASALRAAALLITLGALPGASSIARAAAPAAAPTGAAFGSVDMQRCAQESKLRADSEQEWRSYAQSLDKALQKLGGGSSRLLGEADIKALAALYEKPQLNPAEQKQASDLEAKADAAGAELSRLQQNASPSDADKKRFDELTKAQQSGDAVLQGIRDDYNGRVQQRREELLQKLTGQIRDAVAKVAKDKGLGVVFDAQVAVYTANDITPDVIKMLNK